MCMGFDDGIVDPRREAKVVRVENQSTHDKESLAVQKSAIMRRPRLASWSLPE